MYIDSHVHLFHRRFRDLDAVLSRAEQCGVEAFLCPAIDFASNLSYTERYDNVYFAAGLHPRCVGDGAHDELWEREMEAFAARPRVRAIGETGLDYASPALTDAQRERQRTWFRRLIELSCRTELPLILHLRGDGAYREAAELLRGYALPRPPVVHCFSETLEAARSFLDMGCYFGIGGLATFPETAVFDAIGALPPERLVLETDAPWLLPNGCPGKRNEPTYLGTICECAARRLGMPAERLAAVTAENARRLYRIE